jgi:hypothetical protein
LIIGRRSRRPWISARDQAARLRAAFPGFRARADGSLVIAEGAVRPTGIGATYRIEIRYRLGIAPEVKVLEPRLAAREDDQYIPHMYDQERLCLYLPGSGEWSASMPLGRTVIPWASEWLFYYEMWHATGEWLGGGHETTPSGPYPEEREVMIDGNTRSRR